MSQCNALKDIDELDGRFPFSALHAAQGAADFCDTLVSNGVVFRGDSEPASAENWVDGAADGARIRLYVELDVDSCDIGTAPQDRNLDFAALGYETCFYSLYIFLANVCEVSTADVGYDPNYSLRGGKWGGHCGSWQMAGAMDLNLS